MKLKPVLLALAAVAASLASAHAGATLLTFEDLAEGVVLSNQYAALGATFTPNAFSGDGGPTGGWASNTDMTITATDLGGLGSPSLVSGKMLHAFGNIYDSVGWLSEDGDPSFKITFAPQGASFISMAFAGVAMPEDVKLYAYNGSTLLGTVAGAVTATTGQFTLSYSASKITSVAVSPGSYDDWVGVDNVNFTLASTVVAVPEPQSYALMLAGLGLLGALQRRRVRRGG